MDQQIIFTAEELEAISLAENYKYRQRTDAHLTILSNLITRGLLTEHLNDGAQHVHYTLTRAGRIVYYASIEQPTVPPSQRAINGN
jgi:hypothetical protein